MRARFLEEEDYDTLCKWWTDNRFPIPPKDFLPNNGLDGIMVHNDEFELCAGFIYETSSRKLVWIEFIVSNFEIKDKTLRKESLEFLIYQLIETARSMGKKYIFTSLKHPSLIKRFQSCGFSNGSNNTTEMVMII